MRMSGRVHRSLAAGAGAFLIFTGCNTDIGKVRAQAAADSAAKANALPADTTGMPRTDSTAMLPPIDSNATQGPPVAGVRLEVDINARQVRLLRGNDTLETHPVAVGSPEWPTRTGEWYVTQVVWNPEWIPPDETWAEERKPRRPGDPANPLGQAQLVYDPPRTIHGTNDSLSVGKPVSHGSIRTYNSVVKGLARRLMEETGAGKDEAWYQETQKNRKVKQIVDLPQRVPIRVY
jgi:L,D-transpeptidase ErfK/SrfK